MIASLKALVMGRRGKSAPSRTAVLGARPTHHPAVEWAREDRDGQKPLVIVRVPRRADRLGNALAKIFRLPDHRKVELDEIGSDVWEWCDGETSVVQLSVKIGEKYRLNKRQSEASVTAYLKMLAERRLIGLRAGAAGVRRAPAKAKRKKA